MEKEPLTYKTSAENVIKSLIESWHASNSNNPKEILTLLKKTEELTLNTDWQGVRPLLRLHLTRAIQNCLRSSASSPHSGQLISALIESSVTNKWYQTPLTMILSDDTDCNLNHYCANTDCDVLLTQLARLAQSECKDFASKLCTSCLTIPQLKNNLWLNEIYCTLLFQMGNLEKLTQEMLFSQPCQTRIDFLDQLFTYDADDAFPFAVCVLQILLVNDLLSQTTYSYTKCLMEMWVNVQDKHLLRDKVAMLSRIFATSAHHYLLGHALFTRFGSDLLQMCIELYVKGLTIDLNDLEMARMDKRCVREIEVHLADVLFNLTCIVDEWSLLVRECFLSAFSLDPTEDRMKLVRGCKGFAGSCHCIVRGSCGQFDVDREVDAQLDGLPEELLGDLCIVLNKPRSKMLSWELEWSELEKYCRVHLETKSVVKEKIIESPVATPVKECKGVERKKRKVNPRNTKMTSNKKMKLMVKHK